MTLDELLRQLRAYRILLISASEVWPSPWVTECRAGRHHGMARSTPPYYPKYSLPLQTAAPLLYWQKRASK